MAKTGNFKIEITSAVAIDGKILRAGSTAEVDERLAKNLLHRGAAVLAKGEDKPKPKRRKGPIASDGVIDVPEPDAPAADDQAEG